MEKNLQKLLPVILTGNTLDCSQSDVYFVHINCQYRKL